MDPEDIREVVRRYHSCVVEAACRHKGFVAHTYGNTAVLYFGYPEAHEDDAERAVCGALELIAAVAALKLFTPLQTRVGIATGLVVVGEITDEGGAQQRGIVGENRTSLRNSRLSLSQTPRLSARAHESFSVICSISRIWGRRT